MGDDRIDALHKLLVSICFYYIIRRLNALCVTTVCITDIRPWRHSAHEKHQVARRGWDPPLSGPR